MTENLPVLILNKHVLLPYQELKLDFHEDKTKDIINYAYEEYNKKVEQQRAAEEALSSKDSAEESAQENTSEEAAPQEQTQEAAPAEAPAEESAQTEAPAAE